MGRHALEMGHHIARRRLHIQPYLQHQSRRTYADAARTLQIRTIAQCRQRMAAARQALGKVRRGRFGGSMFHALRHIGLVGDNGRLSRRKRLESRNRCGTVDASADILRPLLPIGGTPQQSRTRTGTGDYIPYRRRLHPRRLACFGATFLSRRAQRNRLGMARGDRGKR